MRCIGFLINPIAGMGGPVGFKGTDGRADEAHLWGAEPMARERAKVTLGHLKNRTDIIFVTCSGEMGADVLAETGIAARVLYEYGGASSAKDTKNAVRQFIRNGADLILFCGGDGTARDVFDVTKNEIPILGIPAGVKMYSAVFAIDPDTAAELVSGDGDIVISEREVMDVDEEAYRAGILHTRLYGYARVPTRAGKTQVSKQVFEEADEERAKDEIARFIHEVMLPDILYILGAGTTTGSIAAKIGIEKTLLGVDVVKNGNLVARDADEKTLRVLVEREKDVRIIVSPIGAQGFIFGRGNQQISGPIIRKARIPHVIIVASPHKLRETPTLYLDTGDQDLNREFGDSVQVISGYRIAQRRKIFQHAAG